MTYQFDIDIATKYGVNEAVMIHNLAFWIKTNASEGRNFKDEMFWTYNSVKAFEKLFPFWTKDTIRRILERLLKSGVIIVGRFNESSYDKTNWYSLSETLIAELKLVEFLAQCIENKKNQIIDNPSKVPFGKNAKSIGKKTQIDSAEKTNGIGRLADSYIGTDINTNNKQQIERGALAFFEANYPSRYETLMMQFKNQINDFVTFLAKFEATFEMEKLEYDKDVISGRFKKFALSWISNQNRFDAKVISIVDEAPKQKIKGFVG